jgi:hypothetical protein
MLFLTTLLTQLCPATLITVELNENLLMLSE